MATVLHEQAETACASGQAEGDDLWLSPADLERATGWMLKPEGLCRASVCIPVPPARAAEFVRPAAVNAAAFWRHIGNPIAHDATGETWVLGTGAADRASALQSLEAPDFTLPDLAGNPASLSQQRGKKVLLATWASW
jgi:AhpC/TSA family